MELDISAIVAILALLFTFFNFYYSKRIGEKNRELETAQSNQKYAQDFRDRLHKLTYLVSQSQSLELKVERQYREFQRLIRRSPTEFRSHKTVIDVVETTNQGEKILREKMLQSDEIKKNIATLWNVEQPNDEFCAIVQRMTSTTESELVALASQFEETEKIMESVRNFVGQVHA